MSIAWLATGSWIVVALVVCAGVARSIRLADRRATAASLLRSRSGTRSGADARPVRHTKRRSYVPRRTAPTLVVAPRSTVDGEAPMHSPPASR